MRLIDTHCHLNLPDCFPHPDPVFRECAEADIGLILVGVDIETSRRAVELAEARQGVWAIIGIHPNYSHQEKPDDMGALADLIDHPKTVALGEIGLDFHWDFATQDEQRRSLGVQLDLAERKGVPVVFHCREAYPELLDFLEARNPGVPMLFHCFAGNSGEADRALALECRFGVDGPLTYKKAEGLREIVASLPRDRVVLETDSPYLTPAPFRGKPNRPTLLPLICDELARVWGIPGEEAAQITTENARSFFRI